MYFFQVDCCEQLNKTHNFRKIITLELSGSEIKTYMIHDICLYHFLLSATSQSYISQKGEQAFKLSQGQNQAYNIKQPDEVSQSTKTMINDVI